MMDKQSSGIDGKIMKPFFDHSGKNARTRWRLCKNDVLFLIEKKSS